MRHGTFRTFYEKVGPFHMLGLDKREVTALVRQHFLEVLPTARRDLLLSNLLAGASSGEVTPATRTFSISAFAASWSISCSGSSIVVAFLHAQRLQ